MSYHVNSPAAIAGGVLAAGGATALLVRDASTTGWTVELALMPVLVALTILSGHHAGKAMRRGKLLSAVGLYALAILGSGITVYETMGRRAEVRDTRTATAADTADSRQHLRQMLAEAEGNVTHYRQKMSDECGSGKGKKCDGLTYTVKTWEAAVEGYQTKIKGLGAPTPVDPKAERVAALASMVGVSASAQSVKSTVSLIEPLALPLFLELGSIVLFGYGLGRSRRKLETVPALQPVARKLPAVDIDDDPPSVSGAQPKSRADALVDLRALLRAGQAPPSQEWLKERWNVGSKGTISKWLAHWETNGELPGNRLVDGRCKTVVAA